MGIRLQIMAKFILPGILLVTAINTKYWKYGVPGSLDANDTYIIYLPAYLGLQKVDIQGIYYYNNVSFVHTLNETMDQPKAQPFADDWEKLYELSDITYKLLVYALVSFFVFTLLFYGYRVTLLIPLLAMGYAAYNYVTTSPDFNKMVFGDEQALYPIYGQDGEIYPDAIVQKSFSLYGLAGAIVFYFLSYLGVPGTVKEWEKKKAMKKKRGGGKSSKARPKANYDEEVGEERKKAKKQKKKQQKKKKQKKKKKSKKKKSESSSSDVEYFL